MKSIKGMDFGSTKLNFKGYKKVAKQLSKLHKDSEKVVQNTVKDFKARAPGWISQEVTAVYNIKKSDLSKAFKVSKGAVGKVSIRGTKVDNIALVYSGRLLTPVHFGMTPKVPPKGRSYTLKAEIYKGKKQVIGRYNKKKIRGGPYSKRSHNILMPTGAKSEDKVPFIPFQRIGTGPSKVVEKFTTLSIPQMIKNEKVYAAIQKRIDEGMQTRLQHHLDRALAKKQRT